MDMIFSLARMAMLDVFMMAVFRSAAMALFYSGLVEDGRIEGPTQPAHRLPAFVLGFLVRPANGQGDVSVGAHGDLGGGLTLARKARSCAGISGRLEVEDSLPHRVAGFLLPAHVRADLDHGRRIVPRPWLIAERPN